MGRMAELNSTEFSREKFSRWLSTELGEILSAYEQEKTGRILPRLFGYHITQIGDYHGEVLHSASHIGHKIVLQLEEDGVSHAPCEALSSAGALPFAADSIDVIIIPHVLEYTDNPHKVLREVERILIADGHLIMTGFNPWSLWGLWRLFLAWREDAPWNGYFYGIARIRDWLALLDFEILEISRFFFRPPLKNMNIMRRLAFLEKLGKFCWPFSGGAYVIHAKKRLAPLTPVKMRWRAQRKLIASGITEPSANFDNRAE